MSGGGGGDTTNVTNETGIGDAQYNTLRGGQEYIAAQDASNYQSLKGGLDYISAQDDRNYQDLKGGLNYVATQDNQNYQNLSAQAQQNLAATQGISGQIGEVGANVSSGFSDLRNTANTGFTNLSNQVDARTGALSTQLGEGLGKTQESINVGFANQAADTRKGFADTQGAIKTGFDANTANVNSRFDAQGKLITGGFADTSNKLDTMQTNVLGGQNTIRSLVEQYGGNLDRYYADLAATGADQTERLGGLQTNLTSFQRDQQKANTIAAQQQAQLSDTVSGGFNAVRDTIGATADAQANYLGGRVSSVADQVAQQGQQTQQNFAQVARDLSQGFVNNSAEGQQTRTDFINKLNTVRSVLSDQTVQLDQTTRQQFAEISQSFDANGQLVSRSLDQQGNAINRAIDGQGNLLVSKLDQQTGQIAQQGINLNQTLNSIDQTVRQGSQGLMGQMQTFQRDVGQNFALIAKQITSGFDDGTKETQAAKETFVNSIGVVKNLLQDQNLQVDQTLRQQYQDLSGAFDESGKLIPRSVDASGIQTARAIDSNGRLLLARFNQNGERVDQQALDLNKMLQALSSSGFVAGSSSSMSQGSPTSSAGSFATSNIATPYTGLMTPYAISR